MWDKDKRPVQKWDRQKKFNINPNIGGEQITIKKEAQIIQIRFFLLDNKTISIVAEFLEPESEEKNVWRAIQKQRRQVNFRPPIVYRISNVRKKKQTNYSSIITNP